MAFWRKKKINEIAVFGIVSYATPFSYDVHDTIVGKDGKSNYFEGEELFLHVMAASVMLSIIELEDDYYRLYHNEIISSLSEHYSKLESICHDFNNFVRSTYNVNERLDSIILEWLHIRIGTGDTSNKDEIEMLAEVVNAIFLVWYDWFGKNDMSVMR